jgi:hypothetical protein
MELEAYKHMVRNRIEANFERIQEYEEKYYSSAPLFARPPEFDERMSSGQFQPQYTFITNPPVRWFEPDTGQPVVFTVNPDGAPASGIADIDASMNAWSTVSGCSLRVQRATQTTTACGPGGGVNTIIFNGCDGRWGSGPGCSGVLAVGGLSWTSQTTVINGVTFRRARDGFVSFNPWCPNSPCGPQGVVTTQLVAVHELGHALGLGHSWQPSHGGSPTAEQLNATMYYIAQFNRCAALATDDINGIVFMYPGSSGGQLTVTTSSLPGGTVGTAYSQSLQASGGTGPYTWSLAPGSTPLPNGLSLSSAGTISGTPTTANTFNFTVRVTDSTSATADRGLSIVVSNPGTAWNAEFVSQTVPSSVSPGQQFNGILSWRNTGTQTWNGSSGFVIRSQNPAGNSTWGGNQVNLTGFSWSPGQTMSLQITFIAPSTPGIYNFQWQCYQNGIGYFGQMSTNISIQVGSVATDNASFVSQSVSSTMIAGQSYSVSVTMQNNGTTAWAAGTYQLGSQNPQDNNTWGMNRVNLASSVSPGSSGTFTFNVTAPSTPSTYNFQWRMHNGTAFFGATSTNVAVTVTPGGGCSYSINQNSQSFPSPAGGGSVNVTAGAGCGWTAVSNNGWITITGGANGTGNGTVTYSMTANTTTANRIGTITVAGLTYTIYQGVTFADVPTSHPFYNEISKLSARGVTLGCGGGNFCPNSQVTREQMAAFIIRALGEFNPPAPPSQRFSDVPPTNPFYNFIDRMAALNITLGCGGGNYCPSSTVTREQMSAFIIRALGEFNPPTPPSQRFLDVPPTNPFYNFIDRMAALNITLGCGGGNYCPSSTVTRAQMAAFLVRAFNL